ncbi:glycosyltransferase family 4 protein [Hanstruepera ponticola]|uniref:glycosyltransferase family 4 protein n=1 Tax=Hanstruepera ponticola TaxID=2042995 RepID=UPI000CF10181|nr:glycosyltransferase family 4 protein [Hanstruepera ponticola]
MKQKIKIGLVLSSPPGYSETFFRNKIRGLQKHGYVVVLFVENLGQIPDDLNCSIYAAPSFNGGIVLKAMTFFSVLIRSFILHPMRTLRLYRLDKSDGFSFKKRIKNIVLNAFILKQDLDWLHFGFGMLAVNRENVAKAIGAQMAVSFRGFDLYLSPLKHPNCYVNLFKKHVHYHVLSAEMKRDLQQYGISSKKIQVITPAIDVSFFQKQDQNLIYNGEMLKIITVARLHWKKGLEYTLEALSLLKASGVRFTYTIIGVGEQYERLMFAAYQLNILDNIHFLGKANHEVIKEQLSKADIYLQYSIQEGFCNAVLEAQAMGLLCISSDAEGLSENILHEQTGWVVPKRQPKLLAEKIQEVMALPDSIKASIRDQAVTRVREQFNLELQQQAFLAFYDTKTNMVEGAL